MTKRFVEIDCIAQLPPSRLEVDGAGLVSLSFHEATLSAIAIGLPMDSVCNAVHNFLLEHPDGIALNQMLVEFSGTWANVAIIYKMLFELGADPNTECYSEYFDDVVPGCLLMEAVAEGRPEIVKILINAGIDVNAHDSWEFREGDEESSLLLLEAGMHPDGYDGEGMTMAAAWGQTRVIKKAIEKGANHYAEAFNIAAQLGHIDIIRLLLKKGLSSKQVSDAIRDTATFAYNLENTPPPRDLVRFPWQTYEISEDYNPRKTIYELLRWLEKKDSLMFDSVVEWLISHHGHLLLDDEDE